MGKLKTAIQEWAVTDETSITLNPSQKSLELKIGYDSHDFDIDVAPAIGVALSAAAAVYSERHGLDD